jgi:hypothetical protein
MDNPAVRPCGDKLRQNGAKALALCIKLPLRVPEPVSVACWQDSIEIAALTFVINRQRVSARIGRCIEERQVVPAYVFLKRELTPPCASGCKRIRRLRQPYESTRLAFRERRLVPGGKTRYAAEPLREYATGSRSDRGHGLLRRFNVQFARYSQTVRRIDAAFARRKWQTCEI